MHMNLRWWQLYFTSVITILLMCDTLWYWHVKVRSNQASDLWTRRVVHLMQVTLPPPPPSFLYSCFFFFIPNYLCRSEWLQNNQNRLNVADERHYPLILDVLQPFYCLLYCSIYYFNVLFMCETYVCVCVWIWYIIACTTIHYNNIDCYCYGYICFMLLKTIWHIATQCLMFKRK